MRTGNAYAWNTKTLNQEIFNRRAYIQIFVWKDVELRWR